MQATRSFRGVMGGVGTSYGFADGRRLTAGVPALTSMARWFACMTMTCSGKWCTSARSERLFRAGCWRNGQRLRLSARGIAVLLIEHDMRFLMALAYRVVVLNFGRAIAQGTPQQVQAVAQGPARGQPLLCRAA